MEEKDEIVVYKLFDSVIDANIAKTKLDAYGVPCFLTEENLSNLYPGQPFIAFKVRLHLFSKDLERANQVLEETSMRIDHESTIRCPKCNSSRITRGFPKRDSESLAVIFFGVLFPHKKVNHCLDCDNEF
jgi:DNA-directed RNA polymerase subunit RPC12/RpoP